MHDGGALHISVQRAIPQDQSLRNQWNALVHQMERPEVFYTWEWAMAVDQAYRASMKPLLLLARDGETLVGVAALATENAEGQVSFLSGNTADYCDFICLPERRGEFVAAALEELTKLRLPIVRLANLPADS